MAASAPVVRPPVEREPPSGRRRRRRWPGAAAATALVLGVPTLLAARGYYETHRHHANPPIELVVSNDPATLARGRYLVEVVLGCGGCHSREAARITRLGLVEGAVLDGSPENYAVGFGTIHAGNLTPYRLGTWSDGEIARAIAEGISRNGCALIGMPSHHYVHLADADLAAIVAYLRTQPAVAHDTPSTHINLAGLVLGGAGIFHTAAQPPPPRPIVAPPRGPTAEYGAYLMRIDDCGDCHGENLAGGVRLPGGPFPMGPNLTRGRTRPPWQPAQLATVLRTGVTPERRRLVPELMPWPLWSNLTDDDLVAIGLHVAALPELPTNRPGALLRLLNRIF
jgi:mono/diheme cytochrome c family protein